MSFSKSMTRRCFVNYIVSAGAAAAWAGNAIASPAAEDNSERFDQMPGPFQIGAASRVINPELGTWVQGAGVTKRGTQIRDNLEANGLFLFEGQTQILLISCDLIAISTPRVARMRQAISQATEIPPRDVLIACTHTHGGPSLIKANYLMPVEEKYLDRLEVWLVELARETVQSARPGKIGWGKGTAQIGWNRRVCWADGTHTMHGDVTRDDFAGMEGPDDPQHLAAFAADTDGKLIAVLHHNTTHPTLFYGAGVFSADVPGEARKLLRTELGAIPVLFLNGAQGDIMNHDLFHPRKESREQALENMGHLLADETLRLYKQVKYHERPVLRHAYEDLEVQIRLPDPEQVAEGRKVLARIDAGENIRGMQMIDAFGAAYLQQRCGENPVETVPVHTVRIGDVALVTQPCELYCQFGLDIKRRSPAPLTAVVGLADGSSCYCPTIHGILGGGYSAVTTFGSRLEPYTGYRIVEAAGQMLNRLWR
jgi:neutral ceramidase